MSTTRPKTFILPNPHPVKDLGVKAIPLLKRKKKKMNVFKRIIKAWLFDEQEQTNDYDGSYPTGSCDSNIESKSSISFKIHAASGGYVVEHRYYNLEQDKYVPPKLTIINSDEDVGKKLKEIIFMESINL